MAELVKNSKPDAAIVFCAEPQTAEQLDAAVYQSLCMLSPFKFPPVGVTIKKTIEPSLRQSVLIVG